MRASDPLLDERAARRIFSEAEDLYGERATFASLGWEVVRPYFPVLAVFRQNSTGVRLFGVELQLRNYDFVPASLTYTDAAGRPLSWAEIVPMLHAFPDPTGGLPRRWIVETSSTTGLPFLCRRGTLEYHSHVQHRQDRWENHRGIVSLQTVLSDAFAAVDPPALPL